MTAALAQQEAVLRPPATLSVLPGATVINPTENKRTQWHLVTRPLGMLCLHPSVKLLDIGDSVDELNSAAQSSPGLPDAPIYVTASGIILTGTCRWQKALTASDTTILCLERAMSDEEAVRFILDRQRPRKGWNQYCRIGLALTLKKSLQARALANMRTGGALKGSANLPAADHIDVRKEIARVAGVCSRNVSKVEQIRLKAHESIKTALRNGVVSINRAHAWSQLPLREQAAMLGQYYEDKLARNVINRAVSVPRADALTPGEILEAVMHNEEHKPGSIKVRISQGRQTAVVIGRELIKSMSNRQMSLAMK